MEGKDEEVKKSGEARRQSPKLAYSSPAMAGTGGPPAMAITDAEMKDEFRFPCWLPIIRHFNFDSPFFDAGNLDRELLAKQPTQREEIKRKQGHQKTDKQAKESDMEVDKKADDLVAGILKLSTADSCPLTVSFGRHGLGWLLFHVLFNKDSLPGIGRNEHEVLVCNVYCFGFEEKPNDIAG